MRDDYRVRIATPDDADAISSVHEAGWRAGYGHLYSSGVIERAVEKHCSRWFRVLTEPGFESAIALLLEANEELIGFAHFGPTGTALSSEQRPGFTELHSFYLHPDHWGTGAARFLMGRVIETVRSQGKAELYLTTGLDVPRARRFYEKMGFVETGRTSVYELLGEIPTPELQYVLGLKDETASGS